MWKNNKAQLCMAVLSLIVLPLFSYYIRLTQPQPQQPSTTDIEIHFIDVGQADAALVKCGGKTMLIDGGNAEDSSLMYSYLKKQGVTHLNYVVATHAHEDHVGGIAGALSYATAGSVFCPVTEYDSKDFNNFVSHTKKAGGKLYAAQVGTTFNLGSAEVKFIFCTPSASTNNSSIVLTITHGKTSFLFTGDAERETEQALLESGRLKECTVLKVGHHGSSTSTTYPFLREIMPEYAVISVGKDNSYGHPDGAVLSRLRDAGVTVYRTDINGTVICKGDGETLSFTVAKS